MGAARKENETTKTLNAAILSVLLATGPTLLAAKPAAAPTKPADADLPTPTLRGLGVNANFPAKDAARVVPLLKGMGVDVVRWLPAEWAGVERQKGEYVIPPDSQACYEALSKAGIRVVYLLFRRNPIYAESKGLDAEAFARYAAFVAKTFTPPEVVAYEIWNEPCNFDFPQYGGKRDEWLARYCEMVREASAAIRAQQPKTPILQTLEVQFWFDALKEHAADFAQIDGTVCHPYPTGLNPAEVSPWAPPVTDAEHSMVGYLAQHAQTYPEKYLHRDLSVWVTEYGFDKGSDELKAAYQVRGLLQGPAAGAKAWCIWPFFVEGNCGLVGRNGDTFELTPSYYALQRTARFLGPDWRAMPDVQCRLDLESAPEVPLGKNRVKGPQVYWFRAGQDWVTFVWNAGRYATDKAPVVGELTWFYPPTVARVEAQDVVTGRTVPVNMTYTSGLVTFSGVPVGANPVAIRWTVAK